MKQRDDFLTLQESQDTQNFEPNYYLQMQTEDVKANTAETNRQRPQRERKAPVRLGNTKLF